MPGKAPQFKLRAKLRERVRSSTETGLPGGWWIWCLFGLSIGSCAWLASRHFLRQQLSSQLAESNSTADAWLAVEGLLTLDERDATELVRGLEHSNGSVARAAFQALDRSISNWRSLAPSERRNSWRLIASRLREMPSSTPPDHLILASSLASRVYADCLAENGPQLDSTIQLCQQIIQRAGQSHGSTITSTENAHLAAIDKRIALAAPPPPLPPDDAVHAGLASATASLSDADSQSTSSRYTDSASVSGDRDTGTSDAQPSANSVSSRATMRLASGPPHPRDDSVAKSSNSLRITLSDPPSLNLKSVAQSLPRTTVSDQQSDELTPDNPQGVSENSQADEALRGAESLPIAELVRLLASVQPRVAQSAMLALRRKGMSDDRLELASELATGTIEQRTRLINSVASRGDIDPRPWLLWMAQDGQPEVRKQSVVLLSSMLDIEVQRQLRTLLNREQDETVAHVIRHALIAPGQTNQLMLR